MDNREKYIIETLEKLNEENKRLECGISIPRKIINNMNLKKIIYKIKRTNIRLKCKLLKINEKAAESNNMQYKPYNGNKKIVVYTCISGNYDNLLDPCYIENQCDYIAYTDQKVDSKIYKVMDIPDDIKNLNNNILINRYIKLNPHKLFKDKYDYSIYIDGNMRPISNISSFVNNINSKVGISMHRHSIRNCIYEEAKILKIYKKGNLKFVDKQIEKYKNDKFPKNYGMVEAGIIVTDLNNENAIKILDEWWSEFVESKSMRDQLSLPYVLWENKLKIDEIATLGFNINKNPKVRKIQHK